jgi:hypothetical protein
LRRNQATGEIALACLRCDLEERGGSESQKKEVAEVMQKKPPVKA